MNNDWFVIKNFEEFVNTSRKLVFNNFGSKLEDDSDIELTLVDLSTEDQKELDLILTYDEATTIVKSFIQKQKNKKTKEIRYVVNEESYVLIITALNDRLVSNLLNGLVNKGLIETAYDEKTNDFIFWLSDTKFENQKPDTD